MDTAEELWVGSVRRYRERERRELRAAWYGWHLDQADRHRRTLEELVSHHETQAARLCEEAHAPARVGEMGVGAASFQPSEEMNKVYRVGSEGSHGLKQSP